MQEYYLISRAIASRRSASIAGTRSSDLVRTRVGRHTPRLADSKSTRSAFWQIPDPEVVFGWPEMKRAAVKTTRLAESKNMPYKKA